jgi:thymidylate synthase
MTLRKAPLRAVAAELVWFLSGSTDNADLHAMDVHFWDPWDSADTNQKMGWQEGQLGPIYGKQWRHWRANMRMPDGQLDQPGLDQIAKLLRGIITTPNSKRLYVTAYDPQDMDQCFVTTCHGLFFCQVWDDQLHLHMVQRSGDVPVGIPFNIASYSLLLMMIARVTGLKPGIFYHTISDAHLYDNQLDAMQVLLERSPNPYPRVEMVEDERFSSLPVQGERETDPDRALANLLAFRPDHFKLLDYIPHPHIKVPVAT